jgi:hypothetical protein
VPSWQNSQPWGRGGKRDVSSGVIFPSILMDLVVTWTRLRSRIGVLSLEREFNGSICVALLVAGWQKTGVM